ncbi:MAG: amino acid adenylation domain-containing protein, partial [Chloroflexota bacterium]
ALPRPPGSERTVCSHRVAPGCDAWKSAGTTDRTLGDLSAEIDVLRQEGQIDYGEPLLPVGRTEPLALSYAQERLWFLDQLAGPSATYNIPMALRLRGQLHVKALEASLQEIVRRHESLRTIYVATDGDPIQVIQERTLEMSRLDLSALECEAQEAEVRRLYEEEAAQPFDLHQDLMVRATLICLERQDKSSPADTYFDESTGHYVLLLTMHHTASDGWSMGIFRRELSTLYAAFSQNQPSPLTALPIQYADFAIWQRKWLVDTRMDEQLAYWKQQLADAPALLELPTDYTRPPIQQFRGGHQSFTLAPKLSAALNQLGAESGATIFMTLLAAFNVLLMRYTGQTDIVVGSPIAGRTHVELESLIGFFVNTLVLRSDLSGDISCEALLAQVQTMTLDAFRHQDIPFEKLVEELQPERSLSHTPLFQVMFVLQNAPRNRIDLSDLQMERVRLGTSDGDSAAKFDLTLDINETEKGLHGGVSYNADLFESSTILRMIGHFQVLLQGIVDNPTQPITQLPLLTAAEYHQIVYQWNDTAVDFGEPQTIHALFEQQVAHTPDTVALVFENERLSYAELNTRSNQLAHYLIALGVQAETLVAVVMERSIEMVISLLAVLKAGGAYVPMDPSYPEERIGYMLTDSAAPILLTQGRLKLSVDSKHIITVDRDRAIDGQPTYNPQVETTTHQLAYVIYTSGSTGEPKGVMIQHNQLYNLVRWYHRKFEITKQDRASQMANPAFDATVGELFPYLTKGATIFFTPENERLSPSALIQWFAEQNITAAFVPTHIANVMMEMGSQIALKWLQTGGDKLVHYPSSDATFTLVNNYGPTENTVDSTSGTINSHGIATVPDIGKPIDNVQVYILSDALQPVPLNILGELYIGGRQLARGYLNRPDLTAERFIDHPEFGRLYKTGDLCRWLPDGNIEFLGRTDFQVKIRGVRIELGEIESILLSQDDVREAVVLVYEDERGAKQLVTYVVASGRSQVAGGEVNLPANLRLVLEERLPDYMIPSTFILLDALPLTPNGKVDRKALPEPDMSHLSSAAFVAPRTTTEESMAAIWCDVLELSQAGIEDDFFHLGGHSLLATQVVSRIRAAFGVELSLRTLFATPTLGDLSAKVDVLRQERQIEYGEPLVPVGRTEPLVLSYAQERLWFLDQLAGPNTTYNMPLALRLRGQLHIEALEASLQEIVRRHESLRTVFVATDGDPTQVICDTTLQINHIDLSDFKGEAQEAEVRRLAKEQASRPFDLSQDMMLRATLICLGSQDNREPADRPLEHHQHYVLLLTMHHIASDGWSMGIFRRELSTLYAAFSQNQPSPLTPLPIQYGDFAIWQRKWLADTRMDEQLAYWTQQLADAPTLLELPTDRPRLAMQQFKGGRQAFSITPELSAALKKLSAESGATIFMTLLAAFNLLLARLSGQDDILVGTPIAGRNRVETENIIGFFLNSLVLRTDLSGTPSFRELLSRVKQTTLDAYSHQDIPFEKLIQELQPERDLSRTPLFQVWFNMVPKRQPTLLPGLTIESMATGFEATAKFDLSIYIREDDECIRFNVVYNANLFTHNRIESILIQYKQLLANITHGSTEPIATMVPFVTRQTICPNNAFAYVPEYAIEKSIAASFETQVMQHRTRIAIQTEQHQWSYQELNRRANQIAHAICGQNAESRRIALLFEHDAPMIAAMLGVLKAGMSYVPLDPTYPEERLLYMLTDAQVEGLMTNSQNLVYAQTLARATVPLLNVDELDETLSTENLNLAISPDRLAYILYTSGSTGQPKGVVQNQRNVLHFIRAYTNNLHIAPEDHLTLLSSYSFDAAVMAIYGALLNGATLCPYDLKKKGVDRLGDWLQTQAITIYHSTPTVYRHFMQNLSPTDQFSTVRLVVMGGELLVKADVELYKQHFLPHCLLVNGLGPGAHIEA